MDGSVINFDIYRLHHSHETHTTDLFTQCPVFTVRCVLFCHLREGDTWRQREFGRQTILWLTIHIWIKANLNSVIGRHFHVTMLCVVGRSVCAQTCYLVLFGMKITQLIVLGIFISIHECETNKGRSNWIRCVFVCPFVCRVDVMHEEILKCHSAKSTKMTFKNKNTKYHVFVVIDVVWC